LAAVGKNTLDLLLQNTAVLSTKYGWIYITPVINKITIRMTTVNSLARAAFRQRCMRALLF
jgi:hypothetical protein